MKSYLQTLYRTKDIFFEVHTSKATCAPANRQDGELRKLMADQHAKEVHHRTFTNRCRLGDQGRVERSDWCVDLILRENQLNFINMHSLTVFASHVQRFGSISMYSTKIGELAHKDQIKDRYRRSNKHGATRQILSHYGRQQVLGIRLQTIESLSRVEGLIVVEDGGMEMLTGSGGSRPRRFLQAV